LHICSKGRVLFKGLGGFGVKRAFILPYVVGRMRLMVGKRKAIRA